MGTENDKYFPELNEWYDNVEKFNIIGFLLVIEQKKGEQKTRKNSWEKTKRKKLKKLRGMGLDKLKQECRRELIKGPKGGNTTILNSPEDLLNLRYTKKSHRKNQIRKVILLFNIITLKDGKRFPFDDFFPKKDDKKEQDDVAFEIEHIIPQSKGGSDCLCNLTLLWKKHNNDLSDADFKSKRTQIKKFKKEGDPILLSTIYVFDQQYSENKDRNKNEWTENNEKAYVKKMWYAFVRYFFPKSKNKTLISL